MENNLLWKYFRKVSEVFLPTPFARRATGQILSFRAPGQISTHALHMDGDTKQKRHRPKSPFYPRPPHGGRLYPGRDSPCRLGFLPTSSTRRATVSHQPVQAHAAISIHTLTRRVTAGAVGYRGGSGISTHAPTRRATKRKSPLRSFGEFLATPSTRRATRTPAAYPDGRSKFLPTPSTRRATLQPRH